MLQEKAYIKAGSGKGIIQIINLIIRNIQIYTHVNNKYE